MNLSSSQIVSTTRWFIRLLAFAESGTPRFYDSAHCDCLALNVAVQGCSIVPMPTMSERLAALRDDV